MNIELKSIQIFERMSEETTAFCASLYIDGKKVGEAKNDGRGGSTEYHAVHPDYWPLIKKAEQYCEGLPPLLLEGVHEGGKPVYLPMNLENFIDEIVTKFAEEKETTRFKKKMQKDQLDAILIGNDTAYSMIYWKIPASKKKKPLADLLSNPEGMKLIKKEVQKRKASMQAGQRILNTNIPKELL